MFRLGHLNVRSLFAGFHYFSDIVTQHNFDVVATTETWLGAHIASDSCVVPGYTFHRCDRLTGRGGGVGIYVKNVYKCERLYLQDQVDGFENIWLKIKINHRICLGLGVIYRTKMNVLNCVQALDKFLPDMLSSCTYITVLGDLNIDLLCSNNISNPISDFFDTFGFVQVIDEPTRVSNSRSSLLDPIFVSDSSIVASGGTLDAQHISDHRLTYCNMKLPIQENPLKFVTFRDYKQFHEVLFYSDLHNVPWHSIYYMTDIDEKVDFLTFQLKSLFELHVPLRTVRVTKPPAPWLTPALKLLMGERDKALLNYKKNNTPENLENYRNLRNLTLRSVRREKSGYLEYLERRGDARILWKGLRDMGVSSGSSNFNDLSTSLHSPEDVNTYFLSVFNKTNTCINKTTFYRNNKYRVGLNFGFSMESPEAILRYIYKIKSNAAGCDDLTLHMLKLSLPATLYPLTHIINCCLETGYFPKCWKESIVCPIPKVKYPGSVTDLRPISLLPVMSKVLERAVYAQINNFLLRNKLYPVHQSGFREMHSTTTAMLNLTDNIFRALDRGMAVLSVSLDYSKAFDVLDHDLLCAKLHYLGFDELSQTFLGEYLADRTQRVRLNGGLSSAGRIISGVPQGSILGPLLFLIYTFDIFDSVSNSHVQSYADDTQLLHYFDPVNSDTASLLLNLDLESILKYSTEHNLKINANKTEVLLFCSEKKRATLQRSITLRLANENLRYSASARNLGLYIDTHLRFKEHIKKLLQTTYTRVKILYSNRYILNFKMRKKLCESLVLSVFNYANIVFYPCLDLVSKNRLQYVQNVCCRFIFGLRKYDHISARINELKWLKISNTVRLHFVMFLFKVRSTSTPIYLSEKLIPRNVMHNCNIRHHNQLTMPQHRSALFQRSFTYMAVTSYNSLDNDFKQCNFGQLRKKYKMFLLSSQE